MKRQVHGLPHGKSVIIYLNNYSSRNVTLNTQKDNGLIITCFLIISGYIFMLDNLLNFARFEVWQLSLLA